MAISFIDNLDIVKQGDPLPTVKNYKPALCDGESHPATYIACDVRKPIQVPFTPSSEDIIFNFAAVHRTPGHPDNEYFETNMLGAQNVCDFAEKYGIKLISAVGPSRPERIETIAKEAEGFLYSVVDLPPGLFIIQESDLILKIRFVHRSDLFQQDHRSLLKSGSIRKDHMRR